MARVRHSFLVGFDQGKDKDFDFQKGVVNIKDFDSALQTRVTVPWDKLSAQLQERLRQHQALQISYSSVHNYDRNVPFKTVQEPGFRVETTGPGQWAGVAEITRQLVGWEFNEVARVDTPNWSSHSEYRKLYDIQGDITNHIDATELKYADSILVTFGKLPSEPNANQRQDDLVFEVYWSGKRRKSMQSQLGLENVQIKNDGFDKVELGLLKAELNDEGEYRVSGLVRDMNKKKFDKVLFFVTPKTRTTDSSFTAEFKYPIGLHPLHKLTFTNLHQPRDNCKLYAKYSVPRSLFLDQYQLADLERSVGSPATGKLVGVWGETDLEAPVWHASGWGSEALIRINPADQFELPMHSRYELPSTLHTQHEGKLPMPAVFWACKTNPGETTSQEFYSLGYESMFPQDETVFYRVEPNSTNQLHTTFTIPVAPAQTLHKVQVMTVAVVLSGFLYLCVKVLNNVRQRRAHVKTD